MVTAKDSHAMTSYYEKCYNTKYKVKPILNRYAARWGFDSVLQSMSMSEAKALVDYYFTVPSSRRHDLEWFFYNYHKLQEAKVTSEKDIEHRRKLAEESRIRAERWRASGKQGLSNN